MVAIAEASDATAGEKDKEALADAEGAGQSTDGAAAVEAVGTLAIVKAEGAERAGKPEAAKEAPPLAGVIFTLGHPGGGELKSLLAVLAKQSVRDVLDARQASESGPQPEAVRVACSASGIAYERQPVLSKAYHNLVTRARGKDGETRSPCVLLSGAASWRLQQTRRCISRFMKAKGLEVRHLFWDGDVDKEAALLCEKEPRREDFKYPKAPPPGRRPSPPPSAPPPMMRPRPKASPTTAEEPAASRGASAKARQDPLLPSRAKASASAVQQEPTRGQAATKEASVSQQPAKPKESSAAAKLQEVAARLHEAAAQKDQSKLKEPLGVGRLKGTAAPGDPTKPKEGSVASAPKEPAKASSVDSTAPAAKGKEALQARPKGSAAAPSGGMAPAEVKTTAGRESAEPAAKGGILQARPKAASAQGEPAIPKAAPAELKAAAQKAGLDAREDDGPSKKPKTGPGPSAPAPAKPSTAQDDLWGLLLNKPTTPASGERAGSAASEAKAKAETPRGPPAASPSDAPKQEAEPGPSAVLRSKPKSSPSAAKAPPGAGAPAAAEPPAPKGSAALQASAKGSGALQASAKLPTSREGAPASALGAGDGQPQPPPVLKASAKGGPQPPKGPPPKAPAGGGAGAGEDGPRPSEGAGAKASLWSLLDGGKRRRL